MRTKDEILKGARDDITNPHYDDKAPFWLEYRKIEALIDIRDMLQGIFNRLSDISETLLDKD